MTASAATVLATGDGVVQVDGPVLSNEPAGDYRLLRLAVPGIAALARPGQFAALTVGGPTSGLLLRRSFSIHRVGADHVDLVIADAGPGTHWLTRCRPGDVVNIVAPLGQGFAPPAQPGACVLVGGGYGSAPLFWFAKTVRAAGCAAHLVLGAASAGRLFGADLAAASTDSVHVTTDDGSLGTRGQVTAVLPDLLLATGARTVVACGPMGMLRAVTEVATAHGATAQVAVEEAMACGVGVCMTCVLPVVGDDGRTRMTRSCVDGPVFAGARVRWDAIADGRVAVPDDAVGAAPLAPIGPAR
ncbi:MAG: dihydroorotate dehydrogenase electron transfer subunit [Tetrasphaera sp.]